VSKRRDQLEIKTPNGLGTVVAVAQTCAGWTVAALLKDGRCWRGPAKELVAFAGSAAVAAHIDTLQDAGKLSPGRLLSEDPWDGK